MCNSCNKTIIKNYNYSCASRPNFNCDCITTLNTKCVDYYGDALVSIGVSANTHTSLEDILSNINEILDNITNLPNIPDLSGSATLTDVINSYNILLSQLRTAGILLT